MTTKYIFRCETAPDYNIQEEINEDDWNLICAKCKKAGIACKTTHTVDENWMDQTEEIWIIEPSGKKLTALVLA